MTDRRSLSANEIAEITATHLVQTPLCPADLLFVFGTRLGVNERVEAALGLWRDKMFRRAIVSGGVTPGDHVSECAIIKAGMVAGGIPATLILEEHRAMNTGENVIFSLPIIDAAIGLGSIRSVICLGNIWTSRRYPMTLHRHWPEVAKMLVVDNMFGVPAPLWHTHPILRALVLAEWDKIGLYLDKGYIAPWPD